MVPVADQDQRVPFFGELDGFHVDLCDQRTSRVDHAKLAAFAGFADFRRNSVRGVDYRSPCGNLFNAVHEDRALLLQFLDNVAVVDDLLADIDRRAEGLKGDANDIDGPHDTRAESAGFQEVVKSSLCYRTKHFSQF